MVELNRRAFLGGGLTAAGAGVVTLNLAEPAAAQEGRPSGRPGDVFQLGVASGDPTSDGVVLWTRLARRPLAEDGHGGMPDHPVSVHWQVAEDEDFRRVVRHGTTRAEPEWAHSVHVEVDGLAPGAEYFYRFKAGSHVSPAGRTLTAPRPDATPSSLIIAQATCSDWPQGYFTAYRRLAEDEPHLVVFLGDYIYTYADRDQGDPRDYAGGQAKTLAGYRQRYAQVKTDPDLQFAHATSPWLVTWSDHEIHNNWAGTDYPNDRYLRRVAAFRAYYENMPLRATAVPDGASMRLYRRLSWGRLATFHMLDCRQYRDQQPCGDGWRVDCPQRRAPERTMLGAPQREWLLDGMRDSGATWNVLGNDVWFARYYRDAGTVTGYNMDAWDGYVADRERVMQPWADGDVRNPVVLTGDVHSHWAADLKADFDDPHSRTLGVELTTTSVSSGGDVSWAGHEGDTIMADNPYIQYWSARRGYIRLRVTPSRLHVDYRELPYVTRRGAPASTGASFLVEDGRPGLKLA